MPNLIYDADRRAVDPIAQQKAGQDASEQLYSSWPGTLARGDGEKNAWSLRWIRGFVDDAVSLSGSRARDLYVHLHLAMTSHEHVHTRDRER